MCAGNVWISTFVTRVCEDETDVYTDYFSAFNDLYDSISDMLLDPSREDLISVKIDAQTGYTTISLTEEIYGTIESRTID